MPSLVGLAFTSPSIAVMVINRSMFRVHLYHNSPEDLHSFLQEADDRLPVVLVDGISALKRLSSVDGVHSFLVTDDPLALSQIEGVVLLDAESDPMFSGHKKKNITPEELNSALLSSPPSFRLPASDSALDDLGDDISFREVLSTVSYDKELGDEFLKNVCSYLVGIIHRKSWVSRVQKPALAMGVPVERLAELEKFIETTHSSEMLWRAFFSHVEASVPLQDAANQFGARIDDLEFIVSVLGTEKPKWVKYPKDKPLVIKTKRRVRKLKGNTIQGTSMNISAPSLPPDSVDLMSVLSRIDEQTGSTTFSRVASAFICRLVESKSFRSASKKALAAGASPDDLDLVSSFALSDSLVWKAFCYHSYYIGVSPQDSARKFGVPVQHLSALLSYKPLAYVFEWSSWPDDLE